MIACSIYDVQMIMFNYGVHHKGVKYMFRYMLSNNEKKCKTFKDFHMRNTNNHDV